MAAAAVSDVISCTFPDPQTLVVVHSGKGAFQDLNIGGLRIVPAHIWGTACNWPSGPHDSAHEPSAVRGAPCVQAGFDPMTVTFNGAPFATPLPPNVNGMLVGSGPYMCVVPQGFANAGKIGGSCAINSTQTLTGQALDIGATERLDRFSSYMRCCGDMQGSNLEALSWADANKDGKVTIVDAAALSFAFGKPDAYFSNPQYGLPGDPNVDIGDAALLASEFDSGTLAPCINLACPGPPAEPNSAAPLLGADFALDPFLANLGENGEKVYYMGFTFSGSPSSGTLELASIGTSNPSPGSFTAIIGTTIVTGTADPVHPGNILFEFSPLLQGHYTVQVKFFSSFFGGVTTTIFNINT